MVGTEVADESTTETILLDHLQEQQGEQKPEVVVVKDGKLHKHDQSGRKHAKHHHHDHHKQQAHHKHPKQQQPINNETGGGDGKQQKAETSSLVGASETVAGEGAGEKGQNVDKKRAVGDMEVNKGRALKANGLSVEHNAASVAAREVESHKSPSATMILTGEETSELEDRKTTKTTASDQRAKKPQPNASHDHKSKANEQQQNSREIKHENSKERNEKSINEASELKVISESGQQHKQHKSHEQVVDLIKQQNPGAVTDGSGSTVRPLARLHLSSHLNHLEHKSIASSASSLPTLSFSESLGNTYATRLAGTSLVVGLPLLALALVAMIVCMFFKFCHAGGLAGNSRGSNGKSHKTSGGGGSSGRNDKLGPESAFKKSPIGFISGGKVIDNLQGVQVIGEAAKVTNLAKKALKRQPKLDRRQLTLDMDDQDSYQHLGQNEQQHQAEVIAIHSQQQQQQCNKQQLQNKQHPLPLQKSPSLFSKATIKSIGRKASVSSTSYSSSSGSTPGDQAKMSLAKRGKSFARSIIMMSRQETIGGDMSSNRMSSMFPQTIVEQPAAEQQSVYQKFGRVKIKMDYDFGGSIFQVTIIEAEDLAAMDLNGYSDPYVTLALIPDAGKTYPKEKTKIKSKTLNPKWNETFKFQVNYSDLTRLSLQLICLDYDRFSKHDEIGQVTIPIESIDLAQSVEEWRDLRRPKDETEKGRVSLDDNSEICV